MTETYSPAFISHHGILGMKWGKRNGPPYPLNESAKSSAEKAADSSSSSREEAKNTAISKGSATEVLKYIDELSTEEIQKAVNRIRWENSLIDLAKKEDLKTTNQILDSLKKANDWMGAGLTFYTNTEKIYNILSKKNKSKKN